MLPRGTQVEKHWLPTAALEKVFRSLFWAPSQLQLHYQTSWGEYFTKTLQTFGTWFLNVTKIETDVACNIRINASELSNRISEAPNSNLCRSLATSKLFMFSASPTMRIARKYLQAMTIVASPAWIGNLPYTVHPPISFAAGTVIIDNMRITRSLVSTLSTWRQH
jgi:hypothetical protein